MAKPNLRIAPAAPESFSLTRTEAIVMHKNLLKLHEKQLDTYQIFIARETALITELRKEINWLEGIDDERFACDLQEQEDEEEEPAA